MNARSVTLEFNQKLHTYQVFFVSDSGLKHFWNESDIFFDAIEIYTEAIDFCYEFGLPVEVEEVEELYRRFEQSYFDEHFKKLSMN